MSDRPQLQRFGGEWVAPADGYRAFSLRVVNRSISYLSADDSDIVERSGVTREFITYAN